MVFAYLILTGIDVVILSLRFSLVSVLIEKIGVLVCLVCQTPKTTFNHISPNFAKYFPFCLKKNCNDLSTFSLVASQLPDADIWEQHSNRKNKIKHKTPSTHCGPIFR